MSPLNPPGLNNFIREVQGQKHVKYITFRSNVNNSEIIYQPIFLLIQVSILSFTVHVVSIYHKIM